MSKSNFSCSVNTTGHSCICSRIGREKWFNIQLFRDRLSDKVHATTPIKGNLGGFEFTVFQRNLKEWHERSWTVCLRVLKESNKSRFDSYSVGNSVLIISHITLRDCRVHIFSDNLSRNSCMQHVINCHIIYLKALK